MVSAVYCTVKTEEQAAAVVDQLKRAGFSNNDISILMNDERDTRDFAIDEATKVPEGAATGASAGAVVGGGLGWLAGIGSLAIPGVGPLIAAGPIMAALTGATIGGALGGVTGALIGMGIPEYEARYYEGKVKRGGVLVSVHSENAVETERAEEIFRAAGAEDISTSSDPATTPRSY